MPPVTATLLVSGPNRPGLIARLSEFVYRNGGNILSADHHAERESGQFFLRLVWDASSFALDRDAARAGIDALTKELGLRSELTYSDVRQRAAVFASRTPHCLYDLLLTWQLGELGGDIALVVSNHRSLEPVAKHFGVRYEHTPTGPGAEARQQALLDEERVDLVVLARYMQVLSTPFVERWHGRVVNIHHSFLPAFVGAQAYRQAKERGVKMIGATAHYVTTELDQGPIIEQDVVRVSHEDEVEDFVRKGRDLEREVLTRAVRWHLERRVIVSGDRTIVFAT
ncbi:MAG TPA: formyltetrahydrofolate deformylase [Candidatus Limnocylindria bacterium]|nr:formyltetrahydrofolate deformylase [Candidatus Limnocylindria bacterium]